MNEDAYIAEMDRKAIEITQKLEVNNKPYKIKARLEMLHVKLHHLLFFLN